MRLKHFISVFLTILTLGISQAWATDPVTSTYTFDTDDNGDSKSITDVTWNIADGAISTSGSNLYLSGTITITLPTDATLESITINSATTWAGTTKVSVLLKAGTTTVLTINKDNVDTEVSLSSNKSNGTYTIERGLTNKNAWITSIDVKYTPSSGGSSKTTITDEQLAWSAASATVTFGDEPYSLPSLTNTIPVSVTYQSTDETVATISNAGVVSILKAGSTTIKAVFAGDATYNAKTVSYTLTVNPAPLTPIAGGIIDELQVSNFEVTSGYTAFSSKQASNTGHSDAVYAGKVSRNGNSTQYSIQINAIGSSGNAAGSKIVTTTSGGYAKRVQAIWATQGTTNTNDRYLTIYGSSSAYTGSETSASGTNLGKLTFKTGDASAYLDIDGDYPYIMIVANGAMYMDQVNVTWVSSAATVAKPTISGTENFVTSTTVTLGCTTDGATIYYTTDGTDPKTSGTKQSGTSFTLTNTAIVRAIANKGSDWSNEATQKTFTKITPITVAAAIGSIPNVDDAVDNQYVVGIVCTAGTSVNGSGQMTYYISDDGSETSRLQIYLGKNLDNSSFTATSDLALGDRVVVYGQLKNFKGTKEMNSGNYLIEKEDAVVSAPVFTPNGGGFMGETNVTITCATGSSNIYYTTDGSTTPSKSSTPYTEPIHLNATTTIKAIAYVGEESSLVVTKTFTLTAPMTVADALTALDSQDPINNAAVVGIISTAPASNPSSGKLTYYISDDGTTDDELEVYLGFGLNGASFSNKTDLQVGDQVTVFGNLTIFSTTTKEFAQGSRLIAFNRPTVDLNSITLPATANVKVGKTVTLTPTFDPTNATDKTVSWSSDDELIATVVDGVVTGVAAGTVDITVTYTANPTIKATCAVTVSEVPSFDDPTYEWQLVTSDAQLVAGKYYVIAYSDNNETMKYAASGNYYETVSSTVSDGAIAYNALGANTAIFALGGNSSAWTLTEVNNSVLLGATTGKNMSWGNNTTWTIAIDDNDALVANTNSDCGSLRYNYNSGSPRFKTYGSTTALPLPQLYVWALKTYKLRYDANGGEDAPAAQVADGEGKATVTSGIPTAPTDKVFDKWNTQDDGNGTDKAAGDVIDLSTADVTLYAIWRDPETVTISYDANGGEGSIDADVDQVEGTQYTIKANTFTRDGYSFIGWKAYDALDNELTITANKITVPSTDVTIKAQWGELTVTDFILVTNINQLQDGDKVYIVAAGSGNAIGTQNTNYRDEVAVLKQGSRVVIYNATPVEFTLGKVGGNYTFQATDGYIFASGTANSGKNYMNTKAEVDDACKWTITIDDEGNTEIKSVENGYTPYMQHNASSHRFACYHTANQQAVVLYKKANYTRAMTEGRYGTICLPNGGVLLGADLYEVAYYGETSKKIFFDEILSGVMEAGVPYVFLPQEGVNKLAVVYTDDADAAATNRNGLVGFIGANEDAETSVPEGMYILQNNQYREVLTGADARIKSYRAYINLGAITPTAPALAPGRRRISMGVASENSATGMDELNASETPVKMMIDGQLYILRGEKLYDATGRLVK